MVQSPARYLRLLGSFARFSLTREMAFRGNFVIKVVVEVLWLLIMLTFYETVFAQTRMIADWSEPEYMFFLGCYFTLESLIEVLFLGNCSEFSELVRTGDLDLYLLRPIDEQFLLSCRNIEWSSLPSTLMGCGLMVLALVRMSWTFHVTSVLLFVVLFTCGLAMAYSFLLLLTSASVWLVRNQSLYELWWLVMSLMRYPKEVFTQTWFAPVSMFFTFVVPIMLIVNVPARGMVKLFEPGMVVFTLLATVVIGLASRRFFRYALEKYRSASS
jgi:ABC-2 type transport system permease protein